MKTLKNDWIWPTVSNSGSIEMAAAAHQQDVRPNRRVSWGGYAWLKKPPRSSSRARLGRYFDVARREQEHSMVGHALHAPIEGVGQAAGEVDQPLREVSVDALEVDDHRDALLEAVGDLLRVVEAARHDQVHLHRRDIDLSQASADWSRLLLFTWVCPVVELLLAPPRREPTDVRLLMYVRSSLSSVT